MKKIGVLVGSLRKDSYNRKMAHILIALDKQNSYQIIEIDNLPLYNQDLDDNPPKEWLDFRKAIKACDGLLFLTPEYNRSIPGALKNAIDIGSRTYGSSVWDGKPGAVMSVSPSAIGAFGANHHLRQTFVFLNIFCMQQPEAYIGNVSQIFNDKGEITKPETTTFLESFMNSFAKWVNKHTQ